MTLIAMAGLPGAGKSTVANSLGSALGAAVISVDPIESAMWTAGISRNQPTGLAAYVVADALARTNVALGQTVIIDAVNAVEPARAGWREIAKAYQAPLCFIEVVCSNEAVHRRRLAARTRDLAGHEVTPWEVVVAARAEWDRWIDERLTLDSCENMARNVHRALDYVSSAASSSAA